MEVRYISLLSIEAMTIKANITNDSCQTDRFIDVGIELTPVTVPLVRLVCGQASLLIGIIAIFPLVCRDESIHMDEFENPVYVYSRRASRLGAIIAMPDLWSSPSGPLNLFTI